MTSTGRLMVLAALASLAGCEGGGGPTEGAANATLRAGLGGDFGASHVRIRGTRALPTDPTYPCLSQFDRCVPLSSAGATEAIGDLCPSLDAPGPAGPSATRSSPTTPAPAS